MASLGCVTHLPGQVDDDGNECPLTDPRGEIILTAYQSSAWVGVDVVGRFQRSTPVRESFSCQRRVVGACAVNDCRNVGLDFVDGEPACGSTSAGSLLVTRGADALPRVDGSGRLTLDRALVEGESFGVRTTGGDVSAFAATVHIPLRTAVTGPEGLLRGTMVSLARDEALTVTWAPTTARVLVIARGNNGGTYTAECAFDGGAGAGTIPAAALPEQTGHVEVWTEDRVDLRVGAFPVAVRARWLMGTGATLVRGGS